MTGPRLGSWTVSEPGFDLLWTRGGLGSFPLVLQLTSHGATFAERDRMLEAEVPRLEQAGAVSRGQVHPQLQQVLSVLAHPDTEVDLRGKAIGRTWRVLAATQGTRGAIAVTESGGIRLAAVDAHDLVARVVETAGTTTPGTRAQLSVATEDLDGVLARGRGDARLLADPLQSLGASHEHAQVLAEALTTVRAQSSIGVAHHERGHRVRGPHIAVVLDTQPGWYLVTQSAARDGRTFTTLREAGTPDIVRAVQEMLPREPSSSDSFLRST